MFCNKYDFYATYTSLSGYLVVKVIMIPSHKHALICKDAVVRKPQSHVYYGCFTSRHSDKRRNIESHMSVVC